MGGQQRCAGIGGEHEEAASVDGNLLEKRLTWTGWLHVLRLRGTGGGVLALRGMKLRRKNEQK